MKTAYFILGMHRSGTSALGGVLNLMGLEFGSDLMAANESNPKGYYENNFVYKLNEKILKESTSSWSDYRFDISMIDKAKKALYIEEAKKIIEDEFRYATKFAVKDPRNCLLFPIWEEACLDLGIAIKVILPSRNPIEVAASLKKRNGFSYEKSLILWSKHFLSADYYSRKYERIFTSFDELINETDATLKILQEFTGFKLTKTSSDKIKNSFLDSSVKHNNILLENFTQDTPLFLQKILKVLKDKNFDTNELDDIRRDFLFSLDFFQHSEIVKSTQNSALNSEILNNIREITFFSQDYYLSKNDDIRNSGINPLEHCVLYGIYEGRFPNSYCEAHGIIIKDNPLLLKLFIERNNDLLSQKKETEKIIQDLKNREKRITELQNEVEEKNRWAFSLNDEIEKLRTTQEELTAQLSQAKDLYTQTQESLAVLTIELQSKEETINDLYTQREELTQSDRQKSVAMEQLNNEISSISNDLTAEKSKNSDLSKEIDEVLQDLVDVKENLSQQIKTLKDREKRITELQNEVEEKNRWAFSLNDEIEKLRTTQEDLTAQLSQVKDLYIELQRTYSIKLDEIEQLNKSLDAIVDDLATIKESKCWIYTKPLRDLQKAIKC